MTKLSEAQIIKIFQKNLNRKFVPEDVEFFKVGTTKIVTKIDTLVQSTDIPPQMDLANATRKSIVACISDFASKGVKPEYGIISINLPKRSSRGKIIQIAKSLKKASEEFHIKILGGDTNEGKEFVFHVCVFGRTKKIITRRNSRVGDSIFVTGPFGYTAAGLKILLDKINTNKSFSRKAINSVLKPSPRLEWGLKSKKYFSSSMDSSDGLSTTLNEMAKQSNHKFVIKNIPANADLYKFAKEKKIDLTELVFHGGEEYEFVFTVPKKYRLAVKKLAMRLKVPIAEIGYVAKGKGVFVKKDNKLVVIKDLGWHHFE